MPSALLRLRSDEQLVAMFRSGNDEAFRAIHDRYRPRLLAYARQMLPGRRQDAEDALQDVFIRAHASLRASGRTITLRAWLYRIAHNRCVDELRRPAPPAPEALALVRPPAPDPVAEAERREGLRRLVQDVRALPDQQRSALLMRELEGISYQELAGALDVTVPAVKSLLVRARVGLAQAREARDAPCREMREELALAVDRGVRPGGLARRHLGECEGCRAWRADLRRQRRSLAALAPVGPFTLAAKLLGLGGIGGGSAGGGAAAATGGAAAGAAAGGGTIGLSHVAAVLAAAVVTAGGAVEVEHSLSTRKAPRAPLAAATATKASAATPRADRAPAAAQAAAPTESADSRTAPATAPEAAAPSDPSQQGAADDALPPADPSGGAAAPSDDPGQLPEPIASPPSGAPGSGPSSTPASGGPSTGAPEATGTSTAPASPPVGAPPDAPRSPSAAPPAP